MYTLKQLRRLRWLVLVAVLSGIGSSIAMNVLHAPSNTPARFVAALPPLAVFAALELIARIPSSSRGLTVFRIIGALVVAGGAATISYAQQMAAVRGLGFQRWESIIWPSIIDGMMIVASVSLVEVVRKIRQLSDPVAGASSPARLRIVADQHEDPATLAYREASRKLREESALAGMNGSAQR
jgi:uncharacterized protein DUF2637